MPKLTPEEAAAHRRQQAHQPINDTKTPARRYLVTLKSGKSQVFTDTRNLSNYKDILMSGMYGIGDLRQQSKVTTTETITKNNVLSIEEIDGDALIGETQNGQEEQETARMKKLLADQEE